MTTKNKPAPPQRGPALDWAAGHGPISGALSATTGCAAVALAGTAAGMPWYWPVTVGAAGAVGSAGAALYRQMTAMTLRTRACSWLAAGGWTSWAVASGPLSWAALGSLTALGVGMGAMSSRAAVHEEAAEEEAIEAEKRELSRELGRERAEIAAEWAARIRRVCQIDVKILGVAAWKSGAGYSLDVQLPTGRHTKARVSSCVQSLAVDARLDNGCTVTTVDGANQSRLVLRVTTRNIMAETREYPIEEIADGPLSILTGIPWGLFPDSHPVVVYLREVCALILGTQGSGKSTFVDAVLAGFARCNDVVTWVIDLKGGAVGQPWVRPWLESKGLLDPPPGIDRPDTNTRPGVDWIARDVPTARKMLLAALRINHARQLEYQELMTRADSTLLPISARLPQIQIVIDEGAELLSPNKVQGDDERKELRRFLLEVMRLARAMGIRVVLTSLDGNLSAIGDTFVRKSAPVNVVLTSASSTRANVDKLFPGVRIDVSQLTSRGSGVVGASTAEGFPPSPFKGWKATPNIVRSVVLATSGWRARLDGPSARAAGQDYADRWNEANAGWLWTRGTTPASTGGAAQAGPPADGARDKGNRGGHRLALSAFRKDDAEDADALAERLNREIDEHFGTTEEPEHPARGLNLSAQRAAAAEESADTEEPADTSAAETDEAAPSAPAGPPWVPAAVTAIRDAGPAGIKPGALAAAIGVDKRTIAAGLAEVLADGVVIYVARGPHSSYVHRDHHTPDPT